jgi:uncharacterized protein
LVDETWTALRALPLAMALRALVRAVVGVDRARGSADGDRAAMLADARRYLTCAVQLATPPPPRLIAVGGLSGTGKSTLAAALAPDLGALPGAIHLRSDLERKGLFAVEPEMRLGPDGYTPEATERTYQLVLDKARLALLAGHSVVVDAVFSKDVERERIEAVAAAVGVPFTGAWLVADPAILSARVAARTGDASDATQDVLAKQLQRGVGDVPWPTVDASGGADATLAAARAVLGRPGSSVSA